MKIEEATMRSLIITLVLFGMTIPAFAQDVSRVAPGIAPVLPQARPEVPDIQTHRTINGEVLILEREYFVVKERSGAEVRLPFNPDVPGERGLRVGDKILAQVTSTGDVTSVNTQSRSKFRTLEESSGGGTGGERGFPFGR